MNATSNGGSLSVNGQRTPGGARHKRKSAPPITAGEALQLLESAIGYCQQAGLTIHAGNVPNLVLSVEGAVMEGDPATGARFVIAEAPPWVVAVEPMEGQRP
jgi:hypothetical protein